MKNESLTETFDRKFREPARQATLAHIAAVDAVNADRALSGEGRRARAAESEAVRRAAVGRIQRDAALWLSGELAQRRIDLATTQREEAERVTKTLTPSVRASIIKAQIDDLIAHDEIDALRAMWAGMEGVDDFGAAVVAGYAPIALQRRAGDAKAYELAAQMQPTSPTQQEAGDLARLERDRQNMVAGLDLVATATRQADALRIEPDTYLRQVTGAPAAPKRDAFTPEAQTRQTLPV